MGMFAFSLLDSVFPILFLIVFLCVMGVLVGTFVSAFKQRRKDDRSPRLTVEATIVAKRQDFRKHSGDSMLHYTDYYVTFQVESGDRMELEVEGRDYGMLVEGDKGKLTFQGSRFLGFERV